MSMFDNSEKDNLYYEIRDFLSTHNLKEFMEVLMWALDD